MRQSPALSRGIVSFVILDSPFCHPRLPLLSILVILQTLVIEDPVRKRIQGRSLRKKRQEKSHWIPDQGRG